MKNIGIALVSILVALFSGNSFANEMVYHIGLDGQVSQINFRHKEVGSFKKAKVRPQLFGGAKINEYVGVEGGFALYKAKADSNSKIRLNQMFLTIIGFYPVASISNMEFIGSLGIITPCTAIHKIRVASGSKKVLPRAMAGLQYSFDDMFSIRGTATWKGSHKAYMPQAKMKENLHYGAGLLVSFY